MLQIGFPVSPSDARSTVLRPSDAQGFPALGQAGRRRRLFGRSYLFSFKMLHAFAGR